MLCVDSGRRGPHLAARRGPPSPLRQSPGAASTPAPELQDDAMEEVSKAFVIPAAQTSHPFRPLEDALKLRFQPTLPPAPCVLRL